MYLPLGRIKFAAAVVSLLDSREFDDGSSNGADGDGKDSSTGADGATTFNQIISSLYSTFVVEQNSLIHPKIGFFFSVIYPH